MRQRLALVTIEENDIAGLCLGLAQLKPEPNTLDLSQRLAAPSACAVAAATGRRFSQRLGVANALIGEMPGFEDCTLVLRDEDRRWFLECYDNGALSGQTPEAWLRALA